jgi:hypothetical protein
MSIVLDWKIKNGSGVCHHSGKRFAKEEKFFTCIFADPKSDGFIRRDYSLAAWKEIGKKLDPAPYSFWKSVYKEQPNSAHEVAKKQNTIEAMLHRMIEEGKGETENARYILALMLERKKILIPTEVKEMANNRLLFYEHKESGAVYIVADPMLRLDEVDKIQEEVAAQLAAEEKRGAEPESEQPVEVANHVSEANGDGSQNNGD